MKCRDILNKLFTLAPRELAEEWDNVGLLAGRPEKEIRKVYIALDATDDVIEHAVEVKADLLLTHHPMIFRPMKTVTGDDFTGRRIMELIRHDISYIALHTNYDVACMGDLAADKLGLKNTEPLCFIHEDGDSVRGLGKTGFLPSPCTLMECADLVKKAFDIPDVRLYGDEDTLIEKAAILPGSGGSEAVYALEKDADVYITGDISHHQGVDSILQGLPVIDAGHYGIEKLFIGHMKGYFTETLPDIRIYTEEISEPFITV